MLDETLNQSGYSVTQRIKVVKQPKGGFINPKKFAVIKMNDKFSLFNNENVSPSLIGLTVDYMTRFLTGSSVTKSFEISLMGAKLAGSEFTKAKELLANIKGLDDLSIICAVKLTGFDVLFRSGPFDYKPIELIKPNLKTIKNIRFMIKRSVVFFKKYGPKILDGFTFEGGYTNIVNCGDGDFITSNTLWDFKVSRKSISKEHTLQLLMYWRMGLHSIHKEFKEIDTLGIFNPRLNIVYILKTKNISHKVIDKVEKEVIGYK